ncbi:trehalose-phosphatase [Cyclobacterium jeungdonense]|uniref:Trehalose 6-phosphate phosphatase n=1 Tax=Cyclobacterium jeungdonense TaxID=708087 RepID=A0ABT8C4H4_9BACT|nr:trehalose-phosphatase [Cyclobacterium jeungdonense]MDN3686688.1 trehalose-phosphatase [Cyclobacterium jeungdonense]
MSKKVPPTIQAIILDMDGVITDSARLHAKAWKQMFDEYLEKVQGKNFDPLDIGKDYKRYIDGVSRHDGVRAFLESRQIALTEGNPEDDPEVDSIVGLGKRKNNIFLDLMETEGVEVFPDTLEMVKKWKKEGIKLAVISASRNCRRILEAADMLRWFDIRIDGEIAREQQIPGKPAPDVFIKAMEDLNADLDRTLIIEDAIAGIKAGKKGGFPVVVGVARNGEDEALRNAGADIVVHELTELENIMETLKKPRETATLPHALESFQDIITDIEGKRPVLFFDYDGTLTPIVEDPNAAELAPDRKKIIQQLSDQFTIAIISGRGLADLKSKVGLQRLIYAGSHGFEISGPNGLEMQYEPGKEILPILDEVESKLKKRVEAIDGCEVERKKYAIAVHYRQVEAGKVAEVENAVEEVLDGQQRLKIGKGKKILELKPDLDWHKGHALNWLLNELDLAAAQNHPIFIGDDITDEDALKALKGTGILVGSHGQKTYADYRLKDTGEVYGFLEELGNWDKGNS